MQKIKISELVKDMGLPEGTIFLGYSIHLQESDEFLLSYEDNIEMTNMWWTHNPEQVKHFQSFKKVEKIKNKIKPEASVAWLFDTGPQIIATQPEGYD